jgi:hypothetical protein
MAEYPTTKSFIIRINRIDAEDRRKIEGVVKVMDGSGDREPFADLNELGVVLNLRSGAPEKK